MRARELVAFLVVLVVALVGGDASAYAGTAKKTCAPNGWQAAGALTRREGRDMAEDEDSAREWLRALFAQGIERYEVALRGVLADEERAEVEQGLREARIMLAEHERSRRVAQCDETTLDTLHAIAESLLESHRNAPNPTEQAVGNILLALHTALSEDDGEALKEPHAWALAHLQPLHNVVDYAPHDDRQSLAAIFDPFVTWSDAEIAATSLRIGAKLLAVAIATKLRALAPWLAPGSEREAIAFALRVAARSEAEMKTVLASRDGVAVAALCESMIKIALEEAGASAADIRAELKFLDVRAKRAAHGRAVAKVTKGPRRV